MIDAEWKDFWWNNITGPQYIVSQVAEKLLENTIVILKVPSDLPWRYQMRSAVEYAFRQRTDSVDTIIETIDAVDECAVDIEPGRYLLDRYGTREIRNGYREKSKNSIQEYLVHKEVLRNRIFWIKGLSGKQANQWVKFCKDYPTKSSRYGLFVLEVNGYVSVPDCKQVKEIAFNQSVSNYDLQLFNSIILDGYHNYSNSWRKYISTVAALLCDVDAEVSELLLRVTDFTTEEPIKGIRTIAEIPEFSLRGADKDAEHVLTYYRCGKIDILNRRVWSAQVQVLFPLIEIERVTIIEEYEQEIRESLLVNNISQYGEQLSEPIDVELGTLDYMVTHRNGAGDHKLYIPDEEMRERIHFLHECRNLLAHVTCCTPQQVSELLKNH